MTYMEKLLEESKEAPEKVVKFVQWLLKADVMNKAFTGSAPYIQINLLGQEYLDELPAIKRLLKNVFGQYVELQEVMCSDCGDEVEGIVQGATIRFYKAESIN